MKTKTIEINISHWTTDEEFERVLSAIRILQLVRGARETKQLIHGQVSRNEEILLEITKKELELNKLRAELNVVTEELNRSAGDQDFSFGDEYDIIFQVKKGD